MCSQRRKKDFFIEKYNEQKAKIKEKLDENSKFSIALDEWTDLNSQRYLVILLNDENETLNLGLVEIPKGPCVAEVLERLVVKKLEENNLTVERDLVGTTNDGAAVMVKYGTLLNVCVQLCINHAIRLAVVDALYKSSNPLKGKKSDNASFY